MKMVVPMNIHRPVKAYYLGEIAFARAAIIQHKLARAIVADGHPDTFLFLQHTPVITLGKNANASHILASPETLESDGIAIAHTDRGGGVTFHGPGQLIVYPIFRIRGTYTVLQYVKLLQGIVISTLAIFGVNAVTRDRSPGLWVEDRKISSIGIRIHNGISTHGLSINVLSDLSGFRYITACNDPDMLHTALQNEALISLDWDTVFQTFIQELETALHMQLCWQSTLNYKG
jgi:lipoate-protein ligase B